MCQVKGSILSTTTTNSIPPFFSFHSSEHLLQLSKSGTFFSELDWLMEVTKKSNWDKDISQSNWDQVHISCRFIKQNQLIKRCVGESQKMKMFRTLEYLDCPFLTALSLFQPSHKYLSRLNMRACHPHL